MPPTTGINTANVVEPAFRLTRACALYAFAFAFDTGAPFLLVSLAPFHAARRCSINAPPRLNTRGFCANLACLPRLLLPAPEQFSSSFIACHRNNLRGLFCSFQLDDNVSPPCAALRLL